MEHFGVIALNEMSSHKKANSVPSHLDEVPEGKFIETESRTTDARGERERVVQEAGSWRHEFDFSRGKTSGDLSQNDCAQPSEPCSPKTWLSQGFAFLAPRELK